MLCNHLIAFNARQLLTSPFSVNDYQVCKQHLAQCPKVGPGYIDPQCENHISHNSSCKQLNLLAGAIQSSIDQIAVTQHGPTFLIKVLFPADGQLQYYIINPKGQIIDVNRLPHQKPGSIVVITKQPVIKQVELSKISYTFTYDIRPCLACMSEQRRLISYIV